MATIRVCMAGLAFGALDARQRPQTSVPAAPVLVDDVPEQRQPEGWPGFWDSSASRVLLISLGLLAGMGATAGIAVVVE